MRNIKECLNENILNQIAVKILYLILLGIILYDRPYSAVII